MLSLQFDIKKNNAKLALFCFKPAVYVKVAIRQ